MVVKIIVLVLFLAAIAAFLMQPPLLSMGFMAMHNPHAWPLAFGLFMAWMLISATVKIGVLCNRHWNRLVRASIVCLVVTAAIIVIFSDLPSNDQATGGLRAFAWLLLLVGWTSFDVLVYWGFWQV